MAVPELALAVILCGSSALASAVPIAAWSRSRDPRFLLVAGANLALLAVGLLWVWGQVRGAESALTSVSLPGMALVTVASVLLLLTGLVRRRA